MWRERKNFSHNSQLKAFAWIAGQVSPIIQRLIGNVCFIILHTKAPRTQLILHCQKAIMQIPRARLSITFNFPEAAAPAIVPYSNNYGHIWPSSLSKEQFLGGSSTFFFLGRKLLCILHLITIAFRLGFSFANFHAKKFKDSEWGSHIVDFISPHPFPQNHKSSRRRRRLFNLSVEIAFSIKSACVNCHRVHFILCGMQQIWP